MLNYELIILWLIDWFIGVFRLSWDFFKHILGDVSCVIESFSKCLKSCCNPEQTWPWNNALGGETLTDCFLWHNYLFVCLTVNRDTPSSINIYMVNRTCIYPAHSLSILKYFTLDASINHCLYCWQVYIKVS